MDLPAFLVVDVPALEETVLGLAQVEGVHNNDRPVVWDVDMVQNLLVIQQIRVQRPPVPFVQEIERGVDLDILLDDVVDEGLMG